MYLNSWVIWALILSTIAMRQFCMGLRHLSIATEKCESIVSRDALSIFKFRCAFDAEVIRVTVQCIILAAHSYWRIDVFSSLSWIAFFLFTPESRVILSLLSCAIVYRKKATEVNKFSRFAILILFFLDAVLNRWYAYSRKWIPRTLFVRLYVCLASISIWMLPQKVRRSSFTTICWIRFWYDASVSFLTIRRTTVNVWNDEIYIWILFDS